MNYQNGKYLVSRPLTLYFLFTYQHGHAEWCKADQLRHGIAPNDILSVVIDGDADRGRPLIGHSTSSSSSPIEAQTSAESGSETHKADPS